MKSIPVDTSVVQFVAIEVVAAERDGEQVTERDTKVPGWKVQALAMMAGAKPEVIEVRIYAPTAPVVTPYAPCEFGNLVGRPWLMDGRAGVSFSAQNVRTAVPSANGRKAETAPAQ